MTEIPAPIRVCTGYQVDVAPIIDDFFDETMRLVRSHECYREGPNEFEIDMAEFARLTRDCGDDGKVVTRVGPVVDDSVRVLKYREKVVAGVIETRDAANWVLYTFFQELRWLDTLR